MSILSCRECGQPSVEDGWCARCMGLPAEPISTARPAPSDALDSMLDGCSWPGVPVGPHTLRQANLLAKTFGGRVLPWAARPQSGGVYPHPGERPSGKPAKYGKELQSGKEEE